MPDSSRRVIDAVSAAIRPLLKEFRPTKENVSSMILGLLSTAASIAILKSGLTREQFLEEAVRAFDTVTTVNNSSTALLGTATLPKC